MEVATGRLIVFDAKETSEKYRFKLSRDHVSASQIVELERYGRGGAHAGLLIEAKAVGRYYWLPWWMLLRSETSYTWAELVDCGDTKRAPNWRAALAANRPIGDNAGSCQRATPSIPSPSCSPSRLPFG
jgi:hypothetical protein